MKYVFKCVNGNLNYYPTSFKIQSPAAKSSQELPGEKASEISSEAP